MGDDGTMAKGTRYTPEFKAVEQVARDPGRRRRCAVGATRRTPWPCMGTARRTPGRRCGAGIGRDQVTNVMRESGIRGVRRGRTPATTKPAKGTGGGPDLVESGASRPTIRAEQKSGHITSTTFVFYAWDGKLAAIG